MKNKCCPNCGRNWNENEIEFQICNNCGFEDSSEAIKNRFRNWGKGFLLFVLVLLISAGVMVVVSLSGASSKAVASIGSAFAFGGTLSIYYYIKDKKAKE